MSCESCAKTVNTVFCSACNKEIEIGKLAYQFPSGRIIHPECATISEKSEIEKVEAQRKEIDSLQIELNELHIGMMKKQISQLRKDMKNHGTL